MTLVAPDALHERFAAIVGADNAIASPSRLRTYECDGLLGYRVRPAIVVLPASTERGRGVRAARAEACTFRSSRAAPERDCRAARCRAEDSIVIGLSRMRRILEVDLANRIARVEPGVINLDITRALADDGYFYAPDPSSQSVCTIGGNVAENAGGAHCLKYGFTVNHVLGLTLVTPDGDVVERRIARRAGDAGLRPLRRRSSAAKA